MLLGRLNAWLRDSPVWQWVMFLLLSVFLVAGLRFIQVPAAILLGCLVAAAFTSMNGWQIKIPLPLFIVAQGVIGCMIARSIVPGVFTEIIVFWPVLLAVVLSVIIASVLLGLLLTRRKLLPGTTGVWGLLPGGATALILMADANGADSRLVAMMQYLRIVMVALLASVVSWIWIGPSVQPPAVDWFPAIDWLSLATTFAIILSGYLSTGWLRIPAGALLLPMAIGAVLQNTGAVQLALPPWLLASSFALVGWSVGVRFTPTVVKHCLRALPSVLLSVSILLAICGGLAALLTRYANIDPLTAYLATSPGGVDSIAVIAASAPVDMPFVVALQTLRFFLVIMLGPWIAKRVSRWFNQK
tara:strand:- start:58910 stop:59983 length:1074 start_codon:yes stop_codon:yes gene_type:complete